jgi:hypothetical protein
MSERDEDDDSDDPDYQPSDDLATQFGALSTANYSLSTDSTPSHAPQNLTSSLRGSLSITPPLRASDAYSRTRELMTPRGIVMEHFIQASTELSSSGSAYATSQSSSGYRTSPSTQLSPASSTPPSRPRAVNSGNTPSYLGSSQGWNSDSSSDDERNHPARTPMVPRYHHAGRLDVSPTERLSTIRATPLGRYQGAHRAPPNLDASPSKGSRHEGN